MKSLRAFVFAASLLFGLPALAVVNIVITPSSTVIGRNQAFDVSVQVQAGSQQLDSVGAYVDFDPTKVQVLSPTSMGSTLPVTFSSAYDNSAGTANCSAGTFSNFPSGTFTMCTIHFQAIGVTNSTALNFHAVNPRNTVATFGGSAVSSSTTGAVVAVVAATATPAPTQTPSPGGPTAVPTSTPGVIPACPGDCDGNGVVTSSETSVCIQISSGALPLSACAACDADGNGTVSAADVTRAIAARDGGCSRFLPTPTRQRRALNSTSEDAVVYGKLFLPGSATGAPWNARIVTARPNPCSDGDTFFWDNGTVIRTCVCKGSVSYCSNLIAVP